MAAISTRTSHAVSAVVTRAPVRGRVLARCSSHSLRCRSHRRRACHGDHERRGHQRIEKFTERMQNRIAGPQSEQGRVEDVRPRERAAAEQHPAAHDDGQGVNVRQPSEPLEHPPDAGALRDQEEPVPDAPQHEWPAGAVPESAQEKHDDQIPVREGSAMPVAAERDVEVVEKPVRQRDVPAAPELADRPRDVGIVEVLQDAEAEHAHQAQRHVRVAGEIEIDLQRVADQAQPGEWRGELVLRQVEDGIGHAAERVRDQHFLPETEQKAAETIGHIGRAPVAACDLVGEVPPADDRARDELREQQNVQREIEEPPLGPGVALVDVDHVRDGVEREERDAERQRDVRQRDRRTSDSPRQQVQIRRGEVRVLEHGERQQVGRYGRREPSTPRQRLARPANRDAESPVGDDRRQDEPHEPALAPHVERHAGDEQYGIPAAHRHDGVRGEHERQKEQEEYRRRKNHEPRAIVSATDGNLCRGRVSRGRQSSDCGTSASRRPR